jgi:hypothetical protein
VLAPLAIVLVAVLVAGGVLLSTSAKGHPTTKLQALTLSKQSALGLYPQPSGDNRTRSGGGEIYGPFVLTYQFEIGADFSEMSPSQSSYPAIGPSDPASQLQTWASQLGVSGAVVTTETGSSWSVGSDANLRDVSIVTLAKGRSGIVALTYRTGDEDSMFNACTPSSPPNLGPVYSDTPAMESAAATFISSLGLNFELGSPKLETGWPSPMYMGCGAVESMTQPILIDGVSTDQVVSFNFNGSGHIVYAGVPVFTLGAQSDYPLRSEAAAAAWLVQSTAPSTKATTTTTKTAPGSPYYGPALESGDLMVVKLRSATVALHAFWAADGSSWFLPVYQFKGDGYSSVVSPNPSPWTGSVLAVGPSYVTIPDQ